MYQSRFELGYVALYVNNLEEESHFYQTVLGLSLIGQEAKEVNLGVGDTILVRLIETEEEKQKTYGLYHLAIVLPSRKDLGTIFRHFLKEKISLMGASDHGYSEAIYLEDPEGNGIEIYRDLAVEEWDIRDNGQIIGKTEAMDAQAVYDEGKYESPYRMPLGARMGHVHLSVSSVSKSRQFYQELLEVEDKFSIPSAAWLASGNYHHHLAVNEWAGQSLSKNQDKLAGLAYYTVMYQDLQAYQEAVKRAQEIGAVVSVRSDGVLLEDEDGICTYLIRPSYSNK